MPEIFYTYYHSPVGTLKVTGTTSCIREILFWQTAENEFQQVRSTDELPEVLWQCVVELNEYFRSERRSFDVAVMQEGTLFQMRVWDALRQVPYGKTISYLELPRRIGDVKAIRAAATTNGKNSIAVIVPCHRVIGSNRDMVGYSGGLWKKRWLLQHEAKTAYGVQTLF